jgi:drug/metabolite transporter (DMT)-like permease
VRFTLAGLMLLVVARRPWRELRATPPGRLIGFAATQTFGQYLLFYLAIAVASGSLAGLLSSLGSFWWMILAPLVGGAVWPTRAQWIAIAVGGAGVAIAASSPGAGAGNPWLGTLLLLGSTGLGTLGLVQFGRLRETIGARAATGFSLLGGGLGLLLAGAGAFPRAALLMPPAAVGLTLWLAFVSAAAFSLWNHLSTRHPVPLLAGYRFLIPLAATVESMLFLGERPGWGFAAGGVLVLGSLVASQRLSRTASGR